MSDKPIPFSAPMVRALLAGTKTQTRRAKGLPVIEQTPNGLWHIYNRWGGTLGVAEERIGEVAADYCHIAVGDRLWVRETSRITSWGEDGEVWLTYAADNARSKTLYADNEDFLERLCNRVEKAGAKLGADGLYMDIPPSALVRPSIFMPRWASRITLHVTDVRVQRLQEISEEDAVAEGCPGRRGPNPDFPDEWDPSPVEEYRDLWNTINGSGSWDTNPWVAAYTFEVERCNIAQARAA